MRYIILSFRENKAYAFHVKCLPNNLKEKKKKKKTVVCYKFAGAFVVKVQTHE